MPTLPPVQNKDCKGSTPAAAAPMKPCISLHSPAMDWLVPAAAAAAAVAVLAASRRCHCRCHVS